MKKNKIDFKVNENGCFIVTSHRPNWDGYSSMRFNQKQVRIHRHIYQECFGEIEADLIVRHKCDTPSCINPEHLELGTHTDNMQDSVIRGRKALGEKSNTTSITEETAIKIKILIRDGKRTCDIVRILGVTRKVVSKIRYFETWKHVNIPA